MKDYISQEERISFEKKEKMWVTASMHVAIIVVVYFFLFELTSSLGGV